MWVLSRATSFEGIVLKTPIYKHHIYTDRRIYKFMTAYQYKKSAKLQNAVEKINLIKTAIEQDFLLELTYLKANDSKLVHTIKPLTFGMQNYQGKLFPALQAICKLNNEKQTFHMGRILELRQVL
jgi:predicted DNA-binding transcriptional regulator YafY